MPGDVLVESAPRSIASAFVEHRRGIALEALAGAVGADSRQRKRVRQQLAPHLLHAGELGLHFGGVDHAEHVAQDRGLAVGAPVPAQWALAQTLFDQPRGVVQAAAGQNRAGQRLSCQRVGQPALVNGVKRDEILLEMAGQQAADALIQLHQVLRADAERIAAQLHRQRTRARG